MISVVAAAAAGLVLPRAAPARMACVDEFSISKEIKAVRVFETLDDISDEIKEVVAAIGAACIAEKDSFSIAIPGGSVVSAFGDTDTGAFDFSKCHVFLCNEKIPSFPCYEGAVEVSKKLGIPDANVHGFGEGSPAEVAAKYAELLKSHPSIDNSGPQPSVDMMLLGTGGDGHCGCLFPDSAEIMATGTGATVLAGNDDRADGDFVAVTMDMMCAAKTVIISAAGSGRAEMVAKALSGKFGLYDCPAGRVEAVEDTLWLTDNDGVAMLDFDENLDETDE